MIKNVIKRDETIENYDLDKIVKAINNASKDCEENYSPEFLYSLGVEVEDVLKEEFYLNNEIPTVEEIQDIVEDILIKNKLTKIAKEYIIYRKERNDKRQSNWIKDDLPLQIYNNKYRYNNENFNEFFERISNNNTEIKKRIKNKEFLPAGRILANRGLHKKGKKISYSNCYVGSPPEDCLESIFDTAKKIAITFSRGGGIGVDIGKLRPRGAIVNNAAKKTTGAVSFMSLYSLVTGLIGQNSRRGALMLSIPINHPDIEEFINIKNDLEEVTKANISLRITDDFIKSVKNDEEYNLHFEVEDTDEVINKKVNANKIMNMIAYSNWNTAEPGVLYWDKINSWNIMSEDPSYEYVGTNPCGEEPLPSGGSCLLGSINLSEMIDKPFTENANFNKDRFKKVVKDSIIYLNEVLDEGLPLHPLKEQRESVNKYRQIGLGIMGFADALIKLKIIYGSKESLKLIDEIGEIMSNTSLKTSSLLAKEKGTFPEYKEKYILESPYVMKNADKETLKLIKKYGLRNSQLLTSAPTGSISSLLGVSGGIEPIFNISYTRKTETLNDGEEFYEVFTPIVKEFMNKKGITNKENLPEYFITAHDLDYKDRINIQSKWQEYIDASISSTVNLDNSTSIEEIRDLYLYAYEKGLKGITIYRDGCQRAGILTNEEKPNKKTKMEEEDWIDSGICPECKNNLNRVEGCKSCQHCGWSACSI